MFDAIIVAQEIEEDDLPFRLLEQARIFKLSLELNPLNRCPILGYCDRHLGLYIFQKI